MRAGEAIFADWRLRFILPARARRARPIFDSLLEPLPVGVRAGAQAPRRIVHRWGRWTVDLRVDWEPGHRVSVTGQLLGPGSQPEEGSRPAVLLVSRHTPVAETGLNRFGEFQFLFHRAPELVIYITLPEQHVIAVELPDPDRPLLFKEKVRRGEERK